MAGIVRVPVVEIVLAAERSTDRQRVRLGEPSERIRGRGVPAAAADDHQWAPGGREKLAEPRQVGRARMRLGALVGIEIRSEEHTSELQSLMRTSYAVFCLTTKNIHGLKT